MAGVSGLEPEPSVLETAMLTIDTIPLWRKRHLVSLTCFLYATYVCDSYYKTY